ncbi:ribosome-binding factor A [Aquifex aeolicus]|uniref:ribosome-binding factor A n=1 Tax=Aquifex aeolicus TaxID=63363 RepID=UPI0000168484|nr:ribosome-binding factor A [Aquifex aeolicus]
MSRKKERLGEQIKEIIASFVVENAPTDLGVVSITRVELSKDGSKAKVYFTVLPEGNAERVKDFLEENKRVLLSKIKKLKVKTIPSLEFEEDREIKIMEKLWEEHGEV